jgi:hypothetical protein
MGSDRHSAAGPGAGFEYQFERALNWLARKEAGTSVGIETGDDVAVRNADASVVLEEDKHSVRETARPFGDRSRGLWNTLALWIEAIESRARPVESTLFLMVTNTAVPSCIARRIASATCDGDVDGCIKDLEQAGEKPPKHLAQLIGRVLCPKSRLTLRALIPRVELEDASAGTGCADLRKSTVAHLQLPSWCSGSSGSIANELSGWLHNTVMSAWEELQPAWVDHQHFVDQLHAILENRKRQIVRERAALLIPVTDDRVGGEKGRPFVKQLYLITDDDALVDTAIREFIRCNIEKARLSKEGNVTDDDWKAFRDTLVARWEKIRSRVKRMKSGNDEIDIGFEIFTETTEDHREKLAGSDTEQVYLTSGTYHLLADLLTVGWHPRYEALMNERLEGQ